MGILPLRRLCCGRLKLGNCEQQKSNRCLRETKFSRLNCKFGTKTPCNAFEKRTPGMYGFPSEFYKFFWTDIKQYLLQTLNYNFRQGELSISQREGLITLLPKKEKDTLLIKNWRPITFLNQDYKLATKAIATRLCKILPNIIHEDQS